MPVPTRQERLASTAIPGQHIKYEWSNVRVIVKPTALGTQLVGDLTYTADTIAIPTPDPSNCTRHVPGEGPLPADSVRRRKSATRVQSVPDFCQCLPYADPDNSRAFGSGLSPDLFGPQGPLGSAPGACELSRVQRRQPSKRKPRVTCHPELAFLRPEGRAHQLRAGA